jgi:signal transduction histidine kinase
MRFADANRRLVEVNRELIEANRGLDEINRTLEDRVAERTAKLQASQAQLVQAEKMAALGHLASGIAHEIKNPLNFVCNFALINNDLAEEMTEEIESNRGRLGDLADNLEDILSGITANSTRIAKHGRQADQIVGSMMEHAQVNKGERVLVKLNPFVEEYVRIAYNGAKSRLPDLNVRIVNAFDEDAGHVEMSPQEVGKVLMNILKNAFEAVYAYKGSDNFEPTVFVSTEQADGHVAIRVHDNGSGIPDDEKARIFEPFFTTKPTGRGNAGLGLSLAHDIVVQGHGGSLRVESEAGHGATFIITLPTRAEADAPVPPL